MVFDPSRPYLVLTSSRSPFFFELFRDMNEMLTSRLRMKANTRSLHALNCRTNNRMLNCSLARTCRACNQRHIHNACFEIFDSAWAVIPRTALEKLHNAAVKFVGSMYMMEKRSNNPHRPRVILCMMICMYRENLERDSVVIRTDGNI